MFGDGTHNIKLTLKYLIVLLGIWVEQSLHKDS